MAIAMKRRLLTRVYVCVVFPYEFTLVQVSNNKRNVIEKYIYQRKYCTIIEKSNVKKHSTGEKHANKCGH